MDDYLEYFQTAMLCLDKICEQKEFFKDLMADKKPFSKACKKPYLQIECKEEMFLSSQEEKTRSETLPQKIILQKTSPVFKKKEGCFSVRKEKAQPMFHFQETRSLCSKLSS